MSFKEEAAQQRLTLINKHLEMAGKLADELGQEGYDVLLSLWREERAGAVITGRFQGNCARAALRETALAR